MTLAAESRPPRTSGPCPSVDLPSPLPESRGPVSDALVRALRRRPWEARLTDSLWWSGSIHDAATDEDLQLALFCVYELRYRGLAGVAEDWEWHPDLVRVQQEWEQILLAGLEAEVGAPHSLAERNAEATVARVLAVARREVEPSLAAYVMREGTADQLRELLVHRSVTDLRAGDGYAWLLPRLSGAPKAALVALQHDTWGTGRLALMRSELFRTLLRSWDLDPRYGHYVDQVPGVTLLATNLVTLLGSHRRWRAALAGHLAASDVAAWLPTARLAHGHRRLGGAEAGSRYFDEQLSSEDQRERLAAHDLVGGVVAQQPESSGDVVFGALCARYAEEALAAHVLPRWQRGLSSLRTPLPAPEHAP